jgi:hypothetical protein
MSGEIELSYIIAVTAHEISSLGVNYHLVCEFFEPFLQTAFTTTDPEGTCKTLIDKILSTNECFKINSSEFVSFHDYSVLYEFLHAENIELSSVCRKVEDFTPALRHTYFSEISEMIKCPFNKHIAQALLGFRAYMASSYVQPNLARLLFILGNSLHGFHLTQQVSHNQWTKE